MSHREYKVVIRSEISQRLVLRALNELQIPAESLDETEVIVRLMTALEKQLDRRERYRELRESLDQRFG